MEYLYQINPILNQNVPIIIYGMGGIEKRLFYALLQQNIKVTAFCLKEGQNSNMKKFFNKKVISLQELKEKYQDAYVIILGQSSAEDGEILHNIGIKNIVVENITLKNKGVLFLGE